MRHLTRHGAALPAELDNPIGLSRAASQEGRVKPMPASPTQLAQAHARLDAIEKGISKRASPSAGVPAGLPPGKAEPSETTSLLKVPYKVPTEL